MSVATTPAPPIVTLPGLTRTCNGLTVERLHRVQLHDLGGGHPAGGDVVEEDSAEFRPVFPKCSQRRLGHLRERFVGGSKHRERSLALEGAGETGLLHEGHQRLEFTGRDRGLHDVGLRGAWLGGRPGVRHGGGRRECHRRRRGEGYELRTRSHQILLLVGLGQHLWS